MTRPASQYSELLSETQPEVIHSEQENQRLIRILETLVSRKQALNPPERKLAELLAVIIKEFEGRSYPMEASGPLDVIRHLMESHSLR
ncbi:MAG: transcriptional regulator, partial [Acidobacteria bacterium]|nr:transcriptional regulator [Acidobacteriota bacterium]